MRSEWKKFYRRALWHACVFGVAASLCAAAPVAEVWAAQATKPAVSGGTKAASTPSKTAAKRPTPSTSAAAPARKTSTRPASAKPAATTSKKTSIPKPAAVPDKKPVAPKPTAASAKPAAGAAKSAPNAKNPGTAAKPVPTPSSAVPPAPAKPPAGTSAPAPAVKAPVAPAQAATPSSPAKVAAPPASKPPAATSPPGAALSVGTKAPSLPPAGQTAPAIRPGVRKNTEKPSRQFGLKAFGVEPPTKTQPPSAAKRPKDSSNASGTSGPDTDEKVSFSAERKYPAEGISPRRAPLPGGRATMSHMDGLPPPEVGVRYKMENGTAARVTVNPQDQSSPIYAPVRPGSNVEGAGVYMDMDVAKNLQFQVGGEVRNFEGSPGDVPGEAAGASMGFRLSF